MAISGMVFDMDGTLTDTERQYCKNWIAAGEEIGINLTEEFLKTCMGFPRHEVRKKYLRLFGDDFDFEGLRLRMKERVKSQWEEYGVPLKEGAKGLLEYCRDKNIPCVVATSTYRESAEYMLKSAGIYDYFTAVVCGDDIENGKPNPDIFLEAAKRIGISATDCGGVEDSKSGIQAVRSAGMISFFIEDTLQADDEIRENADYVCSGLCDVLEILKEINKDI